MVNRPEIGPPRGNTATLSPALLKYDDITAGIHQ
jgi:hypothetical protein